MSLLLLFFNFAILLTLFRVYERLQIDSYARIICYNYLFIFSITFLILLLFCL